MVFRRCYDGMYQTSPFPSSGVLTYDDSPAHFSYGVEIFNDLVRPCVTCTDTVADDILWLRNVR